MTNEAENKFMLAAIESAKEGVKLKDGGPFGCSIVRNGELIAVAHNTVVKCNDPTNHAEMNCIRLACAKLKTHDLSDCELYTTCEPCPMCWGAANWARVRSVAIGADRMTARTFGFDDDFFYKELDLPKSKRAVPSNHGILKKEIRELFQSSPTYRRRLKSGNEMMKVLYENLFKDDEVVEPSKIEPSAVVDGYMRAAVDIALKGMSEGLSKEREPFGAVVVDEKGEIVGRAHNSVMKDHDPTATAEINAIREACRSKGSFALQDCELYTTTEPDPMSLGAVYWSRIGKIHVGVSQKLAASFGYEDGLLHYSELAADRNNRVVTIVEDVMPEGCKAVFQYWKEINGQLY